MANNTDLIKAGLKKRYAREKRFKLYGLLSILFSAVFLIVFLATIIKQAYPAFTQTYIKLDVTLSADSIGVSESVNKEALFAGSYSGIVKKALREQFPDVSKRAEKRMLYELPSIYAHFDLRDKVVANPSLLNETINVWLLADDDVDMFVKGKISRETAESDRRVNDFKIALIDQLQVEGRIERKFNIGFFTQADSTQPEQAGILGGLIGTLLTMVITMALAVPIGVLAALYLEEFASQNNRWVDLVEININNLAAVPSIVFGLLGAAVVIGIMGVQTSTVLAGGIVLSLMTLPTIIISSRAAIKSVPPSIREAALGLGASRMQTTFGHVLPLAMPGILTGSIIGLAQAMGETAPLLMIGMVSFVADVPSTLSSPTAPLPVQIYLWADSAELAFKERSSAAIIVLLAVMVVMNSIAIYMRNKFVRKW